MFGNNMVSKSHSLYDDDDDACYIFNWYEGLSFCTGDKFEKMIKLDPPTPFHEYDNFRILSSAVDGILCIYRWGFRETEVVLWNPATNEVYDVPPNLPESLRRYFSLYGFGYDHVSDDYKIIRLAGDSDPFVWEIYSLRNNSWKQLNVDMPSSYCNWSTKSNVYLNGVCHWLREIDEENYLVSFDLSNEVFFKTPFDMHADFCFNLVVLNGSVAMISNYKETTSFSISLLGEIGVKESWIKLFEIGPLASSVFCPIAAAKKGTIFFRTKDYKLRCFDLTTGAIEKIFVDGRKKSIWDMAIYKKKFIQLKK